MKIILITSLPNLGKIGDIIEVKSGYARNFLIPTKKAICFNENNYKVFESKKHEFELANQKNLEGAEKVKAKIFGNDIVIIENASDDGRLYGSVNSSVIAAKINEIIGQKLVSRTEIFLKKPIKEIGVFDVKLNLHSDVSFSVRLIVSRSESEIEALLKADKKSNKSANSEDQGEQLEAAAVEAEEKPKKPRQRKKSTEVAAE